MRLVWSALGSGGRLTAFTAGCLLLIAGRCPAQDETTVAIERLPAAAGDGAPFALASVPVPSRSDAAGRDGASVSIVAGRPDPNGGGVKCLVDGIVPGESDDPRNNFFFAPGTGGGRVVIDLGAVTRVAQVNSYSWHVADRAPQVYVLFGSDGAADGFDPRPGEGVDPGGAGWRRIAAVDTRVEGAAGPAAGGRHAAGVRAAAEGGLLGEFRYLLFDISRTEDRDSFGNTFFSEIDVVAADGGEPVAAEAPGRSEAVRILTETPDGKFTFLFMLPRDDGLIEWVATSLVPVVGEWYPKVVAMLPSEGFSAPERVTIAFRDGMGGIPAAASGANISCNTDWFRANLDGEARGAVVHELVHVVQQYSRRPSREVEGAVRPPGWLVEGIADYIRWFLYEPESRGAEITRGNFLRARYDASYRVTGNFLDWITRTVSQDAVARLNAAAREGRYRSELWTEITGRSVEELGEAWKREHQRRLGIGADDAPEN